MRMSKTSMLVMKKVFQQLNLTLMNETDNHELSIRMINKLIDSGEPTKVTVALMQLLHEFCADREAPNLLVENVTNVSIININH